MKQVKLRRLFCSTRLACHDIALAAFYSRLHHLGIASRGIVEENVPNALSTDEYLCTLCDRHSFSVPVNYVASSTYQVSYIWGACIWLEVDYIVSQNYLVHVQMRT